MTAYRTKAAKDAELMELHAKIRNLTVEIDFLSKAFSRRVIVTEGQPRVQSTKAGSGLEFPCVRPSNSHIDTDCAPAI
jgi:hypothetical protein